MTSLLQRWNSYLTSQNGVPVLGYHFTGDTADSEDAPYTLSPELFEKEIRYLLNLGYEFTSLRRLNHSIITGSHWPQNGVVLTFDDGRACTYREAFPILKKYNAQATVFLISSSLDNPRFLSVDQIKEMEDYGITFESHGHDHFSFLGLSRDQMFFQVGHSKTVLDKVLHTPVSLFSYPYGHLTPSAEEVLKSVGYTGAVCSLMGLASTATNPFQIPRLGMRGSDSIKTFHQKLHSAKGVGICRSLADYFRQTLSQPR